MKKHIIKINEYSFGIILGVGMSVFVILTNIIFPSNKTDDGVMTVFAFLFLFICFAAGGYIASRKTNSLMKGAFGGGVTALISIGMTMLTFFIIDNLFLDIVSKQPDKIWAFTHQSTYTDMQPFINYGLMRGLIFVLPVITLLGAVLGFICSLVRRKIFYRI